MAKSKKTKGTSSQPAFEDGSYFKDVPMMYLDEDGQWQVDVDEE